MSREEEFQPRPGRMRSRPGQRAKPFVSQALSAAQRAGGLAGRGGTGKRSGSFGRGRAASLRAGRGLGSRSRGAVVKARVVRHGPGRAPMQAHVDYLRRDGATRDGDRGRLFDAEGDDANGRDFAGRCRDDRHHFRFIVSPDDAEQLSDLKGFTRDLMSTAEKDLGTSLDWVAVDHWNTPHPHIHVLVRGVADDGENLVISRDYIREGLRLRAGERVTLELGPRTELEIRRGLEREVEADRWTRLDRSLAREAEPTDGVVDLRPPLLGANDPLRSVKIGRMRKLEQLHLAEPLGPARWRLSTDLEPTLRELGERGDIIKRLHRAMADQGLERAASDLVLNGAAAPDQPVIGRLAARGLDDELRGSAYVVIDGVDGRAHHVRFSSLEAAGDSEVGSVVEARWTEPANGRPPRLVLAVRSDLDLSAQIEAEGATWLDRRLVSRSQTPLAERGFGADVQQALEQRTERLIERGWAERRADNVTFAPGLMNTLRRRELEGAARRISEQTGLAYQPTGEGETIAGQVRRRVTLASGRFAMIDDGLGFQLVPWRDDLGRELGRHVSGIALPGGGVDWSFGRKRGLGL